jgi:hypothetical protein
MKPSDFFIEVEDPLLSEHGLNPEQRMVSAFDSELVDRLRQRPDPAIDDIDAGYALAQLADDELLAYGTGGGERLSDEELAAVLRAIRAVLRRHSVSFDPPFRDWSQHDMGGTGGWAARRGFLERTIHAGLLPPR